MAQKNTTLIYIDEKNLRKYERLNPEQFKAFFMTLFKYRTGDNWDEVINSDSIFDAGLQNMLEEYMDKIDANNKKWEKKARANTENGSKGGRPRKGESREEYQERKAKENIPSTYDMEPNKGFEEEKPVTIPQEPEKPVEQPKNAQEMTVECKPEIPQPQVSSDMGVHISNMIQDPDVLIAYDNAKDAEKATLKYISKYHLFGQINQSLLTNAFKQYIKQTA